VVPGFKFLRNLEIDGVKLKAERYIPLVTDFESEFDAKFDGNMQKVTKSVDEEFDRFSLKTLLADNLASDPAARYQLLQNEFERALHDAKSLNDITFIADNSLPPLVREEVSKLLATLSESNPSTGNKAVKRLFDIYLQREDVLKFSKDFKEVEAMLGGVDNSNPFNWSEFRVESSDDLVKIKGHLDKVKEAEVLATKAAQLENINSAPGTIVLDDKTVIELANADSTARTDSPATLKDKDGRIWSGAILNTDMVQKTMPGNRIGTHRALVVVGNLRGTAGYGMGKGKTSADAINAAFRYVYLTCQNSIISLRSIPSTELL
jgi:hypothetical protein